MCETDIELEGKDAVLPLQFYVCKKHIQQHVTGVNFHSLRIHDANDNPHLFGQHSPLVLKLLIIPPRRSKLNTYKVSPGCRTFSIF